MKKIRARQLIIVALVICVGLCLYRAFRETKEPMTPGPVLEETSDAIFSSMMASLSETPPMPKTVRSRHQKIRRLV